MTSGGLKECSSRKQTLPELDEWSEKKVCKVKAMELTEAKAKSFERICE